MEPTGNVATLGGEAPIDSATPAAPAAATPAAPVNDGKSSIQRAADAARASLAKPADPVAPAPENVIDATAGDPLDTAIESAAGPEAEADPELTISLPPRKEGGEPVEIVLPDKEIADLVRANIRGAIRAQQAHEIRDQAQALRDEADSIKYAVELDPAGLIIDRVTSPQDLDHLFRFLATRPDVLKRSLGWIADMVDTPASLTAQAAVVDAERITRRDSMRAQVEEKRAVDSNARALVSSTERSIDALAPDSFDDSQRAMLRRHALDELRDFARARNLKTVDPRIMPQIIKKVLGTYGVAPKDPSQPVAAEPAARIAPKGAVPATQPTAAQITAQSRARRAAGSAPPGVGSPVGAIPKPPPYDPKQKGSAIQQAANVARRFIAARTGAPK